MITVDRTAPLLTVQDRGRAGFLADGVTRSGPLDRLALDVANALAGNDGSAAAFEGCLGGAAFRLGRDATFAITGADVAATLNGAPISSYMTHAARAGDVIDIERLVRGAVWYLAVSGGIDVPQVLGSRSTLLAAGFGGAGGKPVKAGQTLMTADTAPHRSNRLGVPLALRTPLGEEPIPLGPAPRMDALTADDWEGFYAGSFVVSRAVSRVGYRLEGQPIASRFPADLASEAACAGAMQLPPEGHPIVLMADHPTIGGYPVVGVVPAHAVGWLAQRAPGARVRFERISARAALEARARVRDTLSKWLSRD